MNIFRASENVAEADVVLSVIGEPFSVTARRIPGVKFDKRVLKFAFWGFIRSTMFGPLLASSGKLQATRKAVIAPAEVPPIPLIVLDFLPLKKSGKGSFNARSAPI
jgi:hypothetical protein